MNEKRRSKSQALRKAIRKADARPGMLNTEDKRLRYIKKTAKKLRGKPN